MTKQTMENKINELRKEAGLMYGDLDKALAEGNYDLYEELGDIMSAKYEEARQLIIEFNETFGETPNLLF
ncbi:hypothetical protein KNU91_gp100 [Enterococcus phage nattely]|uniref:Uncharacterized protein n=1 Tax=Enterococcus phage nattely TaxID=2719593 RepID=A0A6G9LLK5_9CAUD|nr:hypothetical protein KNU91_gp100 [Enterococcus phage nattely]QIQ66267.1 hypothetical protein nattely_100 [Enterococcus phage nattely]